MLFPSANPAWRNQSVSKTRAEAPDTNEMVYRNTLNGIPDSLYLNI